MKIRTAAGSLCECILDVLAEGRVIAISWNANYIGYIVTSSDNLRNKAPSRRVLSQGFGCTYTFGVYCHHVPMLTESFVITTSRQEQTTVIDNKLHLIFDIMARD